MATWGPKVMEAWGSEGPRARGGLGAREAWEAKRGGGAKGGGLGGSGPWGLWCLGGGCSFRNTTIRFDDIIQLRDST